MILRRNGPSLNQAIDQLGRLADQAEEAGTPQTLLGIEGTAARLYFEAFPTLLSPAALAELPGPPFSGLRNRRPPTDAVNCLLSFCYALLAKDLLAACLVVGFDPYIGVFHRPRFGRPALALDLAEEFRPLLADSTVLTLINNREVGSSSFTVRAGAVTLTSSARTPNFQPPKPSYCDRTRRPLHFQYIAHRGACGKPPVMPHNRRPVRIFKRVTP